MVADPLYSDSLNITTLFFSEIWHIGYVGLGSWANFHKFFTCGAYFLVLLVWYLVFIILLLQKIYYDAVKFLL